jgi:lysozyme
LTDHEGIINHPYNDKKRYATIGIGHLIGYRPVNNQDKIDWAGFNKQKAFELFKADLTKTYEPSVKSLVKVPLTQFQYDAIVSFQYNTGGLGISNFLKSLNQGKPNGELMLNFKKPAEIIGRRKDEVKLFNTGEYQNQGTATVNKDFKAN